MRSLSDIQSNIVYLGAILVAMVIAGFILIRYVRSRMRTSDAAESFTLDDLRQLRASGQLNDAEYERMRAMLIGARPPRDRSDATDDD
jgi:hypothetical protein